MRVRRVMASRSSSGAPVANSRSSQSRPIWSCQTGTLATAPMTTIDARLTQRVAALAPRGLPEQLGPHDAEVLARQRNRCADADPRDLRIEDRATVSRAAHEALVQLLRRTGRADVLLQAIDLDPGLRYAIGRAAGLRRDVRDVVVDQHVAAVRARHAGQRRVEGERGEA